MMPERILIIFIKKKAEQEKIGKLFLKIGNAGYTNGSLRADLMQAWELLI